MQSSANFSHDELEVMPAAIGKLYKGLEKRIMEDIVRRIKANCGEITRAADWQIYRASELGKAMSEVRDIIQQSLKLSNVETDKIFDKAAKAEWARSAKLYESVGQTPIAYRENAVLQQLVSAIKTQTAEEYANITRTMGVATANKGRIKTVSLTEYYKDTLDNAALDVASGAFDYSSVLRRIVRELTNSGIRTINYDNTGRPTTARIDAAARRALLTGINQLSGRISEENAEKLGTDMYEVSAHSCCRPSHLEWQGKWYTMRELRTVCGYGTAAGLKGPNCRHDFNPVIPGISVPTYTDEQLATMKAQELEKHEYKGKEYTLYEASQRQRRLERTVSSRLHEVELLRIGGASDEDVKAARLSAQAASQEYTRFSKVMGLPQERERIQLGYDGLQVKTNAAMSYSSLKPVATDTETVEISTDRLTNAAQSGIIEDTRESPADNRNYRQFNSGDEVNDFFYFDDDKSGLLAKETSQYGKWKKSLTNDENMAISEYTANGYDYINKLLRKSIKLEEINDNTRNKIENIDAAIARFTLKDNITVQRGIDDFYGCSLIEDREWNDIQEIVGMTYYELGYGSSTALIGNRVAAAKPVLFEIDIPAGTGRGAYVNRFAEQYEDKEYEFLIARGSKFTITDVSINKKPIPHQTIIKMRMIDNE